MLSPEELSGVAITDGRVTTAQRFRDPTIYQDGHTHEGVPPRTIIHLYFAPTPQSRIRAECWLPDAEHWNGCLLGLGNGGPAGHIHNGRYIEPLRAGYAVICTDMGTAPHPDCGIGNPEVAKDFGWRATHLMTVAAKQLIAAAYDKPLQWSYFYGSSTGGQQALQEAQRYPEDYDGIIALVPAHCRAPLHAYFLWNRQILNACPFTAEQEQGIIQAANDYWTDRQPTLFAGQLVADPRCSSDDINAVIALARERDPSLSEQHAQALEKIFHGPRQEVSGAHLHDGVPLGAAFRNAINNTYIFHWPHNKAVDLMQINFAEDIEHYCRTLGPDVNAEDPELRPFTQNGGKIIMASGSADQIVPYHATLDYYERLVETFGSLEEAQKSCRYFLIPGKDHQGGGPGVNQLPDMLALIRQWREHGRAPEHLSCERRIDGELIYAVDVPAYPKTCGHDAPRGGVGRVDAKFL